MRHDIFDNTIPVKALAVTAIGSNTTTNGITVDCLDKGQSILFLLNTGTRTDGTYTPKVEESDNGTDWTEVPDKFLKGTEALAALSAANKISKIGYLGDKRYVRCSVVSSLVTTGASVFATALFQNLHLTDFATQVY